jgi:signal transduction histidine kinase
VAVADDGRGLPARRRDGIGLRSMRDRAEELGGTFRIARRSEGGTIVAAELPLNAGSVPPRGGATTDDAARVIA